MDKGRVTIITSDDLNGETFKMNVQSNHLEAFREFSKKYNLGYDFQNGDYQDAPIRLASDGNLILKTIDDLGIIIIYMPPMVSDTQDIFLHENLDKINKYTSINGYNIKDDRVDMVEDINKLIKIADIKNLRYEKPKKL